MEAVVTQTFKVGDHVSWNSEAGRVSGTIIVVLSPDLARKRSDGVIDSPDGTHAFMWQETASMTMPGPTTCSATADGNHATGSAVTPVVMSALGTGLAP